VITRIRGKLAALTEQAAVVEVGAFDYEVYVPEFVRRQLQHLIGEPVSLQTIQYLEGNPQSGRLTPRLVGFTTDAEREFFEMVCSVDGLGVKKALRAMIRPVAEVAAAIEEQDVKTLATLPGIGPAVAERVVAKLRRKMARFALLVGKDFPAGDETVTRDVLTETYEALVALGHTPSDAREKIEAARNGKKSFKSTDELLRAIYQNQRR
jgi:Holliday junction DNA helicase RuvA